MHSYRVRFKLRICDFQLCYCDCICLADDGECRSESDRLMRACLSSNDPVSHHGCKYTGSRSGSMDTGKRRNSNHRQPRVTYHNNHWPDLRFLFFQMEHRERSVWFLAFNSVSYCQPLLPGHLQRTGLYLFKWQYGRKCPCQWWLLTWGQTPYSNSDTCTGCFTRNIYRAHHHR